MKNARASVFRTVMVYMLCGSLSLQPCLLNGQVGGTDPLTGLNTDMGFATSVPQSSNISGVFQLPFNSFSSDILPLDSLSQSFFRLHTVAGRGLGQADSYTSFGAFLPIGRNNDRFIVDAQARLVNDGSVGNNVGAGWRHYFENQNRILGSWIWYDQDKSNMVDQEQVGLSFESLGKFLDGRFNLYYPLDDSLFDPGRNSFGTKRFRENIIIDDFTRSGEVAMKGFDWELGGPAPLLGKFGVRGYVGMYHFQGGGLQAYGTSTRLEGYIPKANLSYSVKYTNDKIFNSNVTLAATWYFGRSRRQAHFWRNPNTTIRAQSPDFDDDKKTRLPMYYRMGTEPVVRNYTIVTASPEIIDFDELFNADNGGASFNVVHINSNAAGGGDGTFESPFTTLAAADADNTTGTIFYLHSGTTLSGTTEVITLANRQRLLGEDITGTIDHLIRITDATKDNFATTTDGIIQLPLSGSTLPGLPTITNTGIAALTTDVVTLPTAADDSEVSAIIFNLGTSTIPTVVASRSAVTMTGVTGFASRGVTVNGGLNGFVIANPSDSGNAFSYNPTGEYTFDSLTLNNQIGDVVTPPAAATSSAFEVTNTLAGNLATTFNFTGTTTVTGFGDTTTSRRADAINFNFGTTNSMATATFANLQISSTATDNGGGLITAGIGGVRVTTGSITANRGQAVDIDGTGVAAGAAAVNPNGGTGVAITLTDITSINSTTTGIRLDTVDATTAGTRTNIFSIAGTDGTTVTTITNPTSHGIQVEDSVGGTDIFRFSTAPTATTTGTTVSITNSGTGTGTTGTVGDAIRLIDNTGAAFFIDLNSTLLSTTNGAGLIAIDTTAGVVGDFTVNLRTPAAARLNINATGGAAVNIDGVTGVLNGTSAWNFGTLTSTGSRLETLPATGVAPMPTRQNVGIRFADTNQNVDVDTAVISGARDYGILLENNTGAANSVTIGTNSLAGIAATTVTGFVPTALEPTAPAAAIQVDGRNVGGTLSGSADIIFNGTVTNVAGAAIIVRDKPIGGDVTFNSTITDTLMGDGVLIDNNDSIVLFDHPTLTTIPLSLSGQRGIRIFGDTDGTVTFGDNTNGGVEVFDIETNDAFRINDTVTTTTLAGLSPSGGARPTINFNGVIDQTIDPLLLTTTTGFAIDIESIDGGTITFANNDTRLVNDGMGGTIAQPTLINADDTSDGIRIDTSAASAATTITFNSPVSLGTSIDDGMGGTVDTRINGNGTGFALTIISSAANQNVIFNEDLRVFTGDITAGNPGMGGISHTGAGTLTIPSSITTNVFIDTFGIGAEGLVFNGTTSAATFDSILVDSIGITTDAVSFTNVTGTFTNLGTTTVTDTNGVGVRRGVDINGGTATYTFTGATTIPGRFAEGVRVRNLTGAASVTFTGAVDIQAMTTGGGQEGVELTNNDGTSAISFNAVTIADSASDGVLINGNDGSGNITFGRTTVGTVAGDVDGRGIAIAGTAGDRNSRNITFGAGSVINSPDGIAFLVDQYDTVNSGVITYNGTINNNQSLAVLVRNTLDATPGATNGTLTINGSINDTGAGQGVRIGDIPAGSADANDIDISMSGLNLNGTGGGLAIFGGDTNSSYAFGGTIGTLAGNGVTINGSATPITFTNLAITNPNGTAFEVIGGTGAVTYTGGSITQAEAFRLINITGRPAASDIAFSNTTTILATGPSTGINITGSTGANLVRFSNTVTVGNGTRITGDTAVNINFNGIAGAEVEFADLDIQTSGRSGLVASNGGILDINSGTINTINAGIAVDLDAIAQSEVILTSVTSDSNGLSSGIELTDLQSTLTNAFSVGAVTITDSLGAAILIDNSGVANSGGNIGDYAFTGAVNVVNRRGTGIDIRNIADTDTNVTFSNTVTVDDFTTTTGDGILILNTANVINFSGTTTVNDGTVAGADGIEINNTTGNITFANALVNSNAANGILVTGTTSSGMIRFTDGLLTHSAAAGAAIRVDNTSATLDVQYNGSMNVTNGNSIRVENIVNGSLVTIGAVGETITESANADGILLSNVDSAALDIRNASLTGTGGVTITGAGTNANIDLFNVDVNSATAGIIAVNIVGGTGLIDFDSASVIEDSGTGDLVTISGRTGGTITFAGAMSATNDSGGIDISGATGANTINFSGEVNLGRSTANVTSRLDMNTGLTLSNTNAVTTNVNFSGGLDVFTSGQDAIMGSVVAGTLNLNISASGNGTAIDTTGPGAEALNLASISTSTGISLSGITADNLGAGVDAVTINNLDGAGAFAVTGTTNIAATGTVDQGIVIIGGSAAQTWGTTIVNRRTGTGIDVSNRETGSTLTFGTISMANAANDTSTAINMTNNLGTITLTGAGSTLSNLRGNGINISNGTNNATYNIQNFTISRVAGITNFVGINLVSGATTLNATIANNTIDLNNTVDMLATETGIAVNATAGTIAMGTGTSILNVINNDDVGTKYDATATGTISGDIQINGGTAAANLDVP